MRVATVVDAVLEASVVGSFTRLGYLARRRLFRWRPLDELRLDGRVVIVTGATSGIGRAAAQLLARQGADVCVVGRDAERTERARVEIATAAGRDVESAVADLSLLSETAALAERFLARHDRLDAAIVNAGALTHDFTLTPEGNEVTLATHVLSPFLLVTRLLPLLQASAPSRVVLVSSGGMYTQPLDVAALQPRRDGYHGARTYARCKRAQVALAQTWASRLAGTGVTVNAMHPGWVDTPGLRGALPTFSRLLAPLLRKPAEGADTVAWLASAPEAAAVSGRFFLDRRPRASHRLRRTRRADEAGEAERLWQLCRERTGA